MNTSNNPELWDIQLSSWLFCELRWQLCPWLVATSCYFKTSYDARTESLYYDSRLGIQYTWGLSPGFGRQTSGHKPCTSDKRLGRLLLCLQEPQARYTSHKIAVTTSDSLTGTAIHNRFILQTSRATVSHMMKHGTGHTYSVTSCTQRWLLHRIPARTSPCNFSALRYLLRLLSFSADSELTLDYITRLL